MNEEIEVYKCYFRAYKELINHLSNTNEHRSYNISISTKEIDEKTKKILMTITPEEYDYLSDETLHSLKRENLYFCINHNIVINNSLFNILIELIRNDFIENHDITIPYFINSKYTDEVIQRFKNNKFNLDIKIKEHTTEYELAKASNLRALKKYDKLKRTKN